MNRIGIWGIGKYLPAEVRTNDWWPAHTIEKWRKRAEEVGEELRAVLQRPLSDAQRNVIEGMLEVMTTPFAGAETRHIAPAHENATDLEIRAAQDALAQAGVDAKDVGLLLTGSPVPDYVGTPNATIVHEALGLPRSIFAATVESACNAFNQQMGLASAYLEAGRADYALLVQSNLVRRLIPEDARHAPWFGDGATAVVLGPVKKGYGLLGQHHIADGSYAHAMVTGVPGGRWYEGRSILYAEDRSQVSRMLLNVADQGIQVVGGALRSAGFRPEQIDFYASHQAMKWFRSVTQEVIGLCNARSLDTFHSCGSLAGANVPMVMNRAVDAGLLKDGDLVATYSGGSGATVSSMILRWGRG